MAANIEMILLKTRSRVLLAMATINDAIKFWTNRPSYRGVVFVLPVRFRFIKAPPINALFDLMTIKSYETHKGLRLQ